MSGSNNLSLVFSTAVIASLMRRQMSSIWPSSAAALAKYGKYNGMNKVAPVDRYAASPELII